MILIEHIGAGIVEEFHLALVSGRLTLLLGVQAEC